MFTEADIRRLADLARLSISDAEARDLARDVDAILGYVSDVRSAPPAPAREREDLENVMRADESPIEPGTHAAELLAAAPKSEGGYVAVKKIL